MDFTLRMVGLAALLCSTPAWPQAGPHAGHHGAQAPAAKAKPPAAESKPAAAGPRNGALAPYRSAFEGYRAFADEPTKDWRAANDEVKEAGGHVGLMKGKEPGKK